MNIILRREITFIEYEPRSPEELMHLACLEIWNEFIGYRHTEYTLLQIEQLMHRRLQEFKRVDWRFENFPSPFMVVIYGNYFKINA